MKYINYPVQRQGPQSLQGNVTSAIWNKKSVIGLIDYVSYNQAVRHIPRKISTTSSDLRPFPTNTSTSHKSTFTQPTAIFFRDFLYSFTVVCNSQPGSAIGSVCVRFLFFFFFSHYFQPYSAFFNRRLMISHR